MKEDDKPEVKLAPKQDFSRQEELIPEFETLEESSKNKDIRGLFQFQQDEFVEGDSDRFPQTIEEERVESKNKQSTQNRFSKIKLFGMAFGALVVAEAFLFIRELFIDFDLMSAAWLAFFAAALVSAIAGGGRELKSLNKLKKVELLKGQSHYFFNSPASGDAEKFCQKLAAPIRSVYTSDIERWQGSIQEHHTNREVISLFETIVVEKADQRALRIIRKQSTATAALIGVSPLAAIDMLIVLYRNWQMINQISHCYGLSLGYWSKVRLLKQIIRHMIYAGASEILLDASVYALGSSITSKLSTKVAQGIGAGALTGRLGLQVMGQTRPIEWTTTSKPTLTSISKHMLHDLRSL